MPSFRIDFEKDIKGLAAYLEKKFEENKNNLFYLEVSEDKNHLTIIVRGCIIKDSRKYLACVKYLSDALAEYILKTYEKSILERIINRFCKGMPRDDRDEIYRVSCSRLYTSEDNSDTIIKSRKELISSKVSQYLQNEKELALEGFVTFRLGEYVKRLEIEVERSIRQYFVERQYEEYITLLTTFVKMQVPRVPELHVFVLHDGSYKVEGTSPFDIPEDVSDGFGLKKNNPIIQNDDFMIGFLLTCAPVRIFIHNAHLFRNKELLNTIRTVFSECVVLNE